MRGGWVRAKKNDLRSSPSLLWWGQTSYDHPQNIAMSAYLSVNPAGFSTSLSSKVDDECLQVLYFYCFASTYRGCNYLIPLVLSNVRFDLCQNHCTRFLPRIHPRRSGLKSRQSFDLTLSDPCGTQASHVFAQRSLPDPGLTLETRSLPTYYL